MTQILRDSASVDLETDKKIQHVITNEFRDRTLLCVARKLRYPASELDK